ncbi:hypothetical protein QBC37DRAFT_299479 [Rhypophila decipiens]|uniref:Transmembrane protein n=1 Tax=Rhypophila decipiens TaxID=261697 RepID=A0AAN6XUR5_9PEZI|nr:hypothetical protein QBC37DRAFT_299479 [Rhypophila decipiens]
MAFFQTFHYNNADGNDPKAWVVAYTVLVGVVLLAVIPFTFLSLFKSHFGSDPARRFVPWFKASFVLTLALVFTQFVITTCIVYNVNVGVEWHAVRAGLHLGYLAELFRTLSAATVMVFLLELGPGIYHAIHGISSSFERVIRYLAYFLAFVVVALAITYYGLLLDVQLNFSNRVGSIHQFGRGPVRIVEVNKLMAATAIILWVASLAITGLSVYTYLRRKVSPLKTASTLYLAASLLNLLGSTWNFAYAIHWLLGNGRADFYPLVLTIILAWWSRGLLLIISFCIAVRSGPRGGVWSSGHKNGSTMYDSVNRDSYATEGTYTSRRV